VADISRTRQVIPSDRCQTVSSRGK